MTQPILRVLIQEKLANGHSPHAQIQRMWSGPRTPGSKRLFRRLTLVAFAALGTLICVASTGAATLVDSCRILSTFGATYVLTANLTPTSCDTSCLVVTANRI